MEGKFSVPHWFNVATSFVLARITSRPSSNARRLATTIVTTALLTYASIFLMCVARIVFSLVEGSADDVNKLLLALAGIIGGPFLIWRTFIAHQQTVIAKENHYTSLFTKAIEQLGATRENYSVRSGHSDTTAVQINSEVRLGALYALERIARESHKDAGPILETICAYVRSRANSGVIHEPPEGTLPGTDEFVKWISSLPEKGSDFLAAVDVIGRIDRTNIGVELDLSEVNFQDTAIRGDFSSLFFYGSRFDGSTFNGNFHNCNLTNATLDHALLLDVNFTDVNLVRARLRGMMIHSARLDGALLYGADLTSVFGLTEELIKNTYGDAATKLPKNIQRPKSWTKKIIDPEDAYAERDRAKAAVE